MPVEPRVSLPVAVIMGRRMVAGQGWRVPSWRVVALVAGAGLPGKEAQGTPVRGDDDEEHFLWGGLRLDLYRDAADSYWVNLTGRQPSLFVLCSEDEQSRIVPTLVTADQNEACSGVEGRRPRVCGADSAGGLPAARGLRGRVQRAAGKAQAQAHGLVRERGIVSKRDPDAADRDAADEPFLQRWSRLKSADARLRAIRRPAGRHNAAFARGPKPSRRRPSPPKAPGPPATALPDLESLGPDSDYSAFLGPDVDVSLRRAALRKLFRSPKFNVLDGLDDYCDDFTQFAPLAGIVTADMRHHAERAARELLSAEGESKPRAPAGDEPMPLSPADADDVAATRAPAAGCCGARHRQRRHGRSRLRGIQSNCR